MTNHRARWAFLGILALFVMPLVLAWLMYKGVVGAGPTATDNEGRLVIPTRPVDWADVEIDDPAPGAPALDGAWVILYPVADPCRPDCQERVTELGQVLRATGRHADRVRVALLLPQPGPTSGAEPIRETNPAAYHLRNASSAFSEALRQAGVGSPRPSVYLVDPLGNIMMTYTEEDGMASLLQDLEKLLARSKAGTGQ